MVRQKTTTSSNTKKNIHPPFHSGVNDQNKNSLPSIPPSSANPKKSPYDDADREAAAQIAITNLVSEAFDGLMTTAINLSEYHKKECIKPGEQREKEADEFLRRFKSSRVENHVSTEACIGGIVEDSMEMEKDVEKKGSEGK